MEKKSSPLSGCFKVVHKLNGDDNDYCDDDDDNDDGDDVVVFGCWLLNVSATCYCISETDLLRQLYVLPH